MIFYIACVCHQKGGLAAAPFSRSGLKPSSWLWSSAGTCSDAPALPSSIYFNGSSYFGTNNSGTSCARPQPNPCLPSLCVHACVQECMCVPVQLYFTGLGDCASDIQSHTDGIHLNLKARLDLFHLPSPHPPHVPSHSASGFGFCFCFFLPSPRIFRPAR